MINIAERMRVIELTEKAMEYGYNTAQKLMDAFVANGKIQIQNESLAFKSNFFELH
jgi:uncharacterized protein with NAD-binding domain and iron-sulfur cluster